MKPQIEVSYDLANRSVDFLNLRPKRADGTDGPPGDYSGAHIRLGMALSPHWWVDGALWKRRIDYVSTAADITSWQVAGQWKAIDGGDSGVSMALRLGLWGDEAPLLRKTSNVTVQGTKFTSAQATNPRDRQLQLDLVGEMPIGHDVTLAAFVGVGKSKLDFDKVTATTKAKNGCEFQVEFTATHVIETCEMDGATTRISVPNEVYGIDVNREARYTSNYGSIGVNLSWRPGPFRIRVGVQHMALDRDGVDEIVARRGGRAYKSTTVGVAETGYAVSAAMLAFVRAQIMERQFVGEIPMTYNTLTASQHRRRYGILSLGVRYGF